MSPDQRRLDVLLDRLRHFERCLPMAHERAILEVAKDALREEISRLAHRLFDRVYCQRPARSLVA